MFTIQREDTDRWVIHCRIFKSLLEERHHVLDLFNKYISILFTHMSTDTDDLSRILWRCWWPSHYPQNGESSSCNCWFNRDTRIRASHRKRSYFILFTWGAPQGAWDTYGKGKDPVLLLKIRYCGISYIGLELVCCKLLFYHYQLCDC